MTQLSVADLLDELEQHVLRDTRPWGWMQTLNAPDSNLTVKYLHVRNGQRTSLQKHEHKDELLFILHGAGYVEVHDSLGWQLVSRPDVVVRIKPGMLHRVGGPLTYLEVSSYDNGLDTIRIEDDYGRKQ